MLVEGHMKHEAALFGALVHKLKLCAYRQSCSASAVGVSVPIHSIFKIPHECGIVVATAA